jgi:Spy/CpxP family protein refolding chaperone
VRNKSKAMMGIGLLATIVLLLLLDPMRAEAQSLRGCRHPGHGGLVEGLSLTPEQTGEIRRLGAEHRKEQIRQRAALQVARLELAELLAAPTLDEKAIQAKAREIGEQQAAQVRARIEHRLGVARILTPEQRERAQRMSAWRQGGRGCARGAAGHGWRRGSAHWGRSGRWRGTSAADRDARPSAGGSEVQ